MDPNPNNKNPYPHHGVWATITSEKLLPSGKKAVALNSEWLIVLLAIGITFRPIISIVNRNAQPFRLSHTHAFAHSIRSFIRFSDSNFTTTEVVRPPNNRGLPKVFKEFHDKNWFGELLIIQCRSQLSNRMGCWLRKYTIFSTHTLWQNISNNSSLLN